MADSQYAQEVGDWLDTLAPWTFWFTFTYRYAPSLPTVRRTMSRWTADVKPSLVFWGSESGPCTGRNHVHGLLYFDPDRLNEPLLGAVAIRPAALWKSAFLRFGRSAVDTFDPEKGATHYVSKYVTKRLSDFDLWTPEDYERDNSRYPTWRKSKH